MADKTLSKRELVENCIAEITSRNPGAIVSGSDIQEIMSRAGRVPTFLPSIDLVFGGGFPRSKQVQLFGESGAGKSSLILHTIAENQSRDPDFFTVVVNIEGYWNDDTEYPDLFGLDRSRIKLINDFNHERALDLAYKLVQANVVDFLVVDSIGAVIQTQEQAKSLGRSAKVAEKGVILDRFSRKINAGLQTYWDKEEGRNMPNRTAIVLLNQMRTGGIGGDHTFRQPASAESVKFNLALSVGATPVNDIKYAYDEKVFRSIPRGPQSQAYFNCQTIGRRCRFYIDKTRMSGHRGREGQVDLYSSVLDYPAPSGYQGFGFDYTSSLYDAAAEMGIITINGSWETFRDFKIQGEGKFLKEMHRNPNLEEKIRQEVEAKLYGKIYSRAGFEIPEPNQREEAGEGVEPEANKGKRGGKKGKG